MKHKILKVTSCMIAVATIFSTAQITMSAIASDLRRNDYSVDSDTNIIESALEEAETGTYDEIPYIVGEDEALRRENEKHFRLSDGSYVAAIYGEPVHYMDGEEWQDIDNTLVKTEDGYTNKANDFDVTFSSDADSDELYTITNGNHSVKLYMYTPEAETEFSEATADMDENSDVSEAEAETLSTDISEENTAEEIIEAEMSDTSKDAVVASKIESLREIRVPEEAAAHSIEEFDVKSAIEVAEELKEADPNISEEDIKAAVSEQNEINEAQCSEIMSPRNMISSIEYLNAVNGADIEYILGADSIKENIILDSVHDGNVFEFVLDTTLEAKLNEDGTVDLTDGEEVIFFMPAPYMYDAEGESSDDVSYKIENKDGKTILTVEADSKWIESEDRAFPVTVDPTIVSAKTSSADWNIVTQYISDSDMVTPHQGDSYWYAGRDADKGNYYTYLRANYVPEIPYNCRFTRAAISMVLYGYTSKGSASSFNLMVQEALPTWDNQFNSQKETNSNPILDYKEISSNTQGKAVTFDVTNAVMKLIDANKREDGIGFVFIPKLKDGSSMNASNYASAEFQGYDNKATNPSYTMPYLMMEYRNVIGLEDYYTYHTAGAGRAGNAYISDYTGNLTLTRTLVSGTGYDLTYVYNSPYGDKVFSKNSDVYADVADYRNMKSANGWKLNAQQSLVEKDINTYNGAVVTKEKYLVYTDGDGTQHYFRSTNTADTEFADEDGLGLKIVKSGDLYTMSDDKNNRKLFKYGYLTQIIDSNDNKTIFLYDTTTYSASGGQPVSGGASSGKNQLRRIVYLPNGESEPITAATLTYDSSTKFLTSVTDRAGRAVNLSVSSDGYLTSITDPDGNKSVYRYTASPSRLEAAFDDEAGYGLEFGYIGGDSISYYGDYISDSAYSTVKTEKNSVIATRSIHSSTFRNLGSDLTLGTDDDINTRYTFDTYGRTITTRTTDKSQNMLGASGGEYTSNSGTDKTNNKILKEGGTGALAANGIRNSGMESAALIWTFNRQDTTHYTGSVVRNMSRTGNSSYKMESTVHGGWMNIHQSQQIPKAGTYTLSAYVKVTSIGDTGVTGAGLKASILDTSSNSLASSRIITEITAKESDKAGEGWVRLSCTYTAEAAQNVLIAIGLNGVAGTVYVDDVQFEKNESPSPYNLLCNGDFRSNTDSWTCFSSLTGYATAVQPDGTSGRVMKITGAPDKEPYAAQTVNVNLPGSETYIMSGWGMAESVPTGYPGASFQLTATIEYSDGSSEFATTPFSYLCFGKWQYICTPVVPKKPELTVSKITVTCSYKKNANTAYFDDISLIRESAQCYTYDDDGKITAVNKTNTDELSGVYKNGDLISSTGGANGKLDYTYDSKHNLTSAKNDDITMNLTYDSKGNVTNTMMSGANGSYMSTSATYTDKGTKLSSTTDNLGNTTENTYYTEKNLLKTVTAPISKSIYNSSEIRTQTTSYNYDASDRMSLAFINGKVSLDYAYDKGNLTQITRGGYIPGNSTKQNQTYSFEYNDYGQKTKTKVGDYTLATNEYYEDTNNLFRVVYGNGQYIGYDYDKLDRLTERVYNQGGVRISEKYTYDYMGNVSKVALTNRTTKEEITTYTYEYDSLGRPVCCTQTCGDEVIQKTEQKYDEKNRPLKYTYFDGEKYRTIDNVYDDDNGGVLTKYDYGTNGAIGYEYDSLNRVSKKYLRHSAAAEDYWTENYRYKAGASSNQTTSLVGGIDYIFANDIDGSGDTFTLNYTYDNLGNITKVTKTEDGEASTVGRYVYDEMNQLVLEDVYDGKNSYTKVYKYDTYGNIRSEKKYRETGYYTPYDAEQGTLLEEKKYTYGNGSWRDLLTAYDGHTITYDAIGNPTTYYNGNDTYNFTWERGRQLKSAVTTDSKRTITYTYNKDGIRTGKKVDDAKGIFDSYEMSYRLDGDKITEIEMKAFGAVERYVITYDESGNPYSITHYYEAGIDTYYYVLNAQGDVIELRQADGSLQCRYIYDAWGKILSVYDVYEEYEENPFAVAYVNPFRYRGYVYDQDTKLYYCQSRYYDPQIRRFINADSLVSTDSGFNGFNMFAYCNNNPVNNYDPTGHWIIKNAIKWVKNKIVKPAVKWVAKNVVKPVVKPIVKTTKKVLSNVNATYSTGINISGSPSLFNYNVQGGISIDTNGNVAIQGSIADGLTSGTPGISVSSYRTVTNAPSVKNLEDMGYQIGGSVAAPVYGVPLAAGRDLNIMPDMEEKNKVYFGLTTTVGFGTPGSEFHVEMGQTGSLDGIEFNIFDVPENVYRSIMEW